MQTPFTLPAIDVVVSLEQSKIIESGPPMPQNTSHAVMAQRTEASDSLDDFPTPPWATRAFVEHVLGGHTNLRNLSVLEPACGRGDMAKALGEYFGKVEASDIEDYGYGKVVNFITGKYPSGSYDWVITNPPFKLAEDFIRLGLEVARFGVAMLTRTVFIESIGRFERLFSQCPPAVVAQYVERVPMVKGRLDQRASTATGYCWLVWTKLPTPATRLHWIPPLRKRLERRSDYDKNRTQLELLS